MFVCTLCLLCGVRGELKCIGCAFRCVSKEHTFQDKKSELRNLYYKEIAYALGMGFTKGIRYLFVVLWPIRGPPDAVSLHKYD